MPLRARLTFVAALAVMLWTTGARVHACSCMRPGPPCQATWEADAVFAGQVSAIAAGKQTETIDGKEYARNRRQVSIKVTEVFRGQMPATAIVETGMDSGDCGYAFEIGKAYVVYAHRKPDGGLVTSSCSRTAAVSDAADDLSYLRGLATGTFTSGFIVGEVRQIDTRRDYVEFREGVPYAGGRVVIAPIDPSRKDRYQTLTGADGKFRMPVPVGKYTVTLTVRDGLYATGPFRPVEVRDVRGCADADFMLMPDGRIGGRVLDAEGRPVSGLSVDALSSEQAASPLYMSSIHARTDASGAFEFTRLRADTYVLGLMLRRLQKSAEPDAIWFAGPGDSNRLSISIEPEQRAWIGDVQLPDSVKLTSVDGTVLHPDGRPAVGAKVYILRDGDDSSVSGPIDVDANGRFALSVVAGRKYSALAEFMQREPSRFVYTNSPVFNAEPGHLPPIDLRFKDR